MITRLIIKNKAYRIINEYAFSSSNSEVTFNDIVIDFTKHSIADIPFKYQEVQIKKAESEKEILNGEVIFTGFVETATPQELKDRDSFIELTLSILSPLAMTTKRSVSLIGTYTKEEAVRRVLQPLVDDGFMIFELNIAQGQVTTNFVISTVENCMNNLAIKLNFFWHIDERKNIYVNDLDYLFGKEAKLKIDSNTKGNGFLDITPKIENIDYANIINFKNVRVYYHALTAVDGTGEISNELDFPVLNLPKKIKKGDIVQFNNPIVINEDLLKNMRDLGEIQEYDELESLHLTIGNEEFYVKIDEEKASENFGKLIDSGNISYSDNSGEEKTVVLQKDSFFSSLITGFKWNGEDDVTITYINTITALRYTTMRFMHSNEINNMKGIISRTGIIEKNVDYNEKWTTVTELIDYARSLMTLNTNTINQVLLNYDINPKLKISDIVEIEDEKFLIKGKFAVKQIDYNFYAENHQTWKITLKNADLNASFIDMFRPSEQQETQENIDTVILSEFIEENIYEKHEVNFEEAGHEN